MESGISCLYFLSSFLLLLCKILHSAKQKNKHLTQCDSNEMRKRVRHFPQAYSSFATPIYRWLPIWLDFRKYYFLIGIISISRSLVYLSIEGAARKVKLRASSFDQNRTIPCRNRRLIAGRNISTDCSIHMLPLILLARTGKNLNNSLIYFFKGTISFRFRPVSVGK